MGACCHKPPKTDSDDEVDASDDRKNKVGDGAKTHNDDAATTADGDGDDARGDAKKKPPPRGDDGTDADDDVEEEILPAIAEKLLAITVHSATGLRGDGDSIQPYVVLEVVERGDVSKKLRTRAAAHGGTAPIWNEIFPDLDIRTDVGVSVRLTVYDQLDVGADQFLGFAEVTLSGRKLAELLAGPSSWDLPLGPRAGHRKADEAFVAAHNGDVGALSVTFRTALSEEAIPEEGPPLEQLGKMLRWPVRAGGVLGSPARGAPHSPTAAPVNAGGGAGFDDAAATNGDAPAAAPPRPLSVKIPFRTLQITIRGAQALVDPRIGRETGRHNDLSTYVEVTAKGVLQNGGSHDVIGRVTSTAHGTAPRWPWCDAFEFALPPEEAVRRHSQIVITAVVKTPLAQDPHGDDLEVGRAELRIDEEELKRSLCVGHRKGVQLKRPPRPQVHAPMSLDYSYASPYALATEGLLDSPLGLDGESATFRKLKEHNTSAFDETRRTIHADDDESVAGSSLGSGGGKGDGKPNAAPPGAGDRAENKDKDNAAAGDDPLDSPASPTSQKSKGKKPKGKKGKNAKDKDEPGDDDAGGEAKSPKGAKSPGGKKGKGKPGGKKAKDAKKAGGEEKEAAEENNNNAGGDAVAGTDGTGPLAVPVPGGGLGPAAIPHGGGAQPHTLPLDGIDDPFGGGRSATAEAMTHHTMMLFLVIRTSTQATASVVANPNTPPPPPQQQQRRGTTLADKSYLVDASVMSGGSPFRGGGGGFGHGMRQQSLDSLDFFAFGGGGGASRSASRRRSRSMSASPMAAGFGGGVTRAEVVEKLAAFLMSIGRGDVDAEKYLLAARGHEDDLCRKLQQRYPERAGELGFLMAYHATVGEAMRDDPSLPMEARFQRALLRERYLAGAQGAGSPGRTHRSSPLLDQTLASRYFDPVFNPQAGAAGMLPPPPVAPGGARGGGSAGVVSRGGGGPINATPAYKLAQSNDLYSQRNPAALLPRGDAALATAAHPDVANASRASVKALPGPGMDDTTHDGWLYGEGIARTTSRYEPDTTVGTLGQGEGMLGTHSTTVGLSPLGSRSPGDGRGPASSSPQEYRNTHLPRGLSPNRSADDLEFEAIVNSEETRVRALERELRHFKGGYTRLLKERDMVGGVPFTHIGPGPATASGAGASDPLRHTSPSLHPPVGRHEGLVAAAHQRTLNKLPSRFTAEDGALGGGGGGVPVVAGYHGAAPARGDPAAGYNWLLTPPRALVEEEGERGSAAPAGARYATPPAARNRPGERPVRSPRRMGGGGGAIAGAAYPSHMHHQSQGVHTNPLADPLGPGASPGAVRVPRQTRVDISGVVSPTARPSGWRPKSPVLPSSARKPWRT